MSPRGSRAIGLLALLMLVALVSSLDRWIALDAAVWHQVLLERDCATDHAVERGVGVATRGLAALLVVAVALHARKHGLRSTWPWIGTWALGLLTSKMLKHVLTRDRPSSLPDLAVGYSFPSAHVMNGVLAMAAVIALAHGFRRRHWWYFAAGLSTSVLAIGRILLGRHWASDAFAGGLGALVLLGFLVPAIVRRPIVAPLLLAATLLATLAADRWIGREGLQLPSPLVGRRAALVDVDVGPEMQSTLSGSWKDSGLERPFGSYLWLEGEATVPFDVPAPVVASGSSFQLAFAGRPRKDRRSCQRLEVDLNGQRLARFVPFVGWREYRLPVPPNLLRPGRNEVTITAAGSRAPARFGVTYVRVAAARSAAE